jgi:hypothetical protein
MFTEPSKPLDIHINKPILSKLNLLVIKGEFDKGLLTLKIKEKENLFKQRCARSSYHLAINSSFGKYLYLLYRLL